MKNRVFDELLWRFGKNDAPQVLSMKDEMLPSASSPKIRMEMSWGTFARMTFPKSLLTMLPIGTLPSLNMAEFSYETSFRGYSDGSGMSVHDFKLKQGDDQTRIAVRDILLLNSRRGFGISRGVSGMLASLKLLYSVSSKRLTIPSSLDEWVVQLNPFFFSDNEITFIINEKKDDYPCLAHVASQTLSSLSTKSLDPAEIAKDACKMGRFWASRK